MYDDGSDYDEPECREFAPIKRKARYARTCDRCKLMIQAGELYKRGSFVFDGEVSAYSEHIPQCLPDTESPF
jgi:hypothetical protein